MTTDADCIAHIADIAANDPAAAAALAAKIDTAIGRTVLVSLSIHELMRSFAEVRPEARRFPLAALTPEVAAAALRYVAGQDFGDVKEEALQGACERVIKIVNEKRSVAEALEDELGYPLAIDDTVVLTSPWPGTDTIEPGRTRGTVLNIKRQGDGLVVVIVVDAATAEDPTRFIGRAFKQAAGDFSGFRRP